MEDLNSVTLIGRLTRDPELRSIPSSGQSVCEVRLAFNTSQKIDGQWADVGNFVNVTIWGAQGESLARNLTKGQRVGVKGRLQWREWKTQDGQTREQHSIVADRVQYLDPKADGQRPAQSTARQTQANTPAPQASDDDSVPF